MIVPTLRVTVDAERPWRHSHAERGNDQRRGAECVCVGTVSTGCGTGLLQSVSRLSLSLSSEKQ
ncbi:hypothetical protein C1X29_20140 [Pseudomonas sp. GW456-12-10-14-LB2]|nr:hypothetical protein C1X29_20140 [Pseudomonas sp. GW456-12-10-14-LB2]